MLPTRRMERTGWVPGYRGDPQEGRNSEALTTTYLRTTEETADASACEYDAFLSFRGPDTRTSFTDVLYDHMSRAGLHVFCDDVELAPGDMISKILPAIDSSKLCIPIFSKTFASSKWCLMEVTRMVELRKQIWPIFYDVTVEDVELETTVYTNFMDKHEAEYGENEVERWKDALKTIAAIKGKEVLNISYTTFCKRLVEELLIKLKPRKKFDINPVIGLEDQIEHAMQLLDTQSPGVRYMGIYGMGGIGKTTLARVIFNEIAGQFDCCSFIEDVRESSGRQGIEYMLDKLLQSLHPTSGRVSDSSRMMEECFRMKKVLIVLDDVDQWKQIEKLAGKSSWFGSGSRIIITTRNKSILEIGYGKLTEDEVCDLEVEPLGHDDALRLFNRHAFKEGNPTDGFEELSKEAASLAAGLPLALTIIGSLLYNRKTELWEEVIKKLKKVPEAAVKSRLRISYDALEHEQKQIFLDIACFFIGSATLNPIYMWEACEFYPRWGLEVLRSMSLIKVSDDYKIWMHDVLRDLGRDIVREENINNPLKRSRLWEDETAQKVMMSKKDKELVEALRIEESCAIDLNQTEIGSLESLRYLELRGANLKGDFEDLLPNLRWLSYHYADNLDNTNFGLSNLVILDFSYSTIDENWGGWSQLKNAKSLKVLDLTEARNLTRTPYFPAGMSLERLVFHGCSALIEIDGSIGNLTCLEHLNLQLCYSLTGLPEELGHLKQLEVVLISGLYQPFKLPESIGNLVQLKVLFLMFLGLRRLPDSFGKLKNVVFLELRGEIVDLPDLIEGLQKLKVLSFMGSVNLRTLPRTLGALKSLLRLDLSYSALVELPSCVGELERLQHLLLSRSHSLEKLPDSLGRLRSLVELDMTSTRIAELPESIGGLENLELLSLLDCSRIRALPATLGNLKSLVKLELSSTGITELPESIGGLENLREIGLAHCPLKTLPGSFGALKKLETMKAASADFSGGLPNEISGLSSLRIMNLSRTQVRALPCSVNQLHLLTTLILDYCDELQELPDLPVNLKMLSVSSSESLHRVHNLSNLQSLAALMLAVSPKSSDSDFGISLLSQLVDLRLFHPVITALPEEFGKLTQLKKLMLICQNLESARWLPPNLEEFSLWRAKHDIDLRGLLGLKKLSVFKVQQLVDGDTFILCNHESLTELHLTDCPNLVGLGMSNLKNLKKLCLLRCQRLNEILGLGELTSLNQLHIEGCDSLMKLENLSELKEIENVRIASCGKLCGIEGIDGSKICIVGGNSQDLLGGSAREAVTGEQYDLSSLLSSPGRDFLIRRMFNQEIKVKIDQLNGKKVGLYFCRSFWGTFHHMLEVTYKILYPRGDFEVVFVLDTNGGDDAGPPDSFLHTMSWLTVPFSDSEKIRTLCKLFGMSGRGAPQLLIFDENGRLLTTRGFEIIGAFGVSAYPFTPERIRELKSADEDAWNDQPLTFVLKHAASHDFIYSYGGNQLPLSAMNGKIVGIYFSSSSYQECNEFTLRLGKVYQELKAEGENFEIVWAPIEKDYDSYSRIFMTTPWLALLGRLPSSFRLYSYFGVSTLPTLVVIGSDGKTLHPNAAKAVAKYGVKAYPYTPEKIAECSESEEAGIAISGCRKFAITNRGHEARTFDLVGKNLLLFFSAHRLSESQAEFLPKLIEAYYEIKARDEAFEVIFISNDEDEASFHESFAKMPWLAIPFQDARVPSLYDKLKVTEIPRLVAIGPTDQIITIEAYNIIAAYGSEAYPFTEEHISNMAKGWPRKLRHALHEHELALTRDRRNYICDGCHFCGHVWSYCCTECDFDLHPKCALSEGKPETSRDNEPCVGLGLLLRGESSQSSTGMRFERRQMRDAGRIND